MQAILSSIADTSYVLALWVVAFFIVFGLLARITPCNPGQSLWRKDSLTDIAYCFIMPILNRVVRTLFIALGASLIFYGESWDDIMSYLVKGYGPLGAMPIWWQAAIMFMVSDVIIYWMHRWFHGKRLWKFHAIHHSSPVVDWLSAYRFHPVNSWIAFTLVDASMMLIGFAPAAVAAMATVNTIYSAMVHANLNWTFGPFKYLFVSPVFHRWHHTAQEEGMDKNFAPTFPLIDIVFGTFYMPEGRLPERFGVPGSDIPEGFLAQMIWPFKRASKAPGRE